MLCWSQSGLCDLSYSESSWGQNSISAICLQAHWAKLVQLNGQSYHWNDKTGAHMSDEMMSMNLFAPDENLLPQSWCQPVTLPLCNPALKVPHDSGSNWDKWRQGHEWLRASYVAGRLWWVQSDIITTSVLIRAQSWSCNPVDHRNHTVLSHPHATFSASSWRTGNTVTQSQLHCCHVPPTGKSLCFYFWLLLNL